MTEQNAIEVGGNSVGAHQAVIYSESRCPVRKTSPPQGTTDYHKDGPLRSYCDITFSWA